MDNRKLEILSIVVGEYIKTGEAVSSKTISNILSFKVSSATIRNDMAILEKQGFLDQLYTSSGRIPSYKGYRTYINLLMKPYELSQDDKITIDNLLECQNFTMENIIENSLDVLSNLTGCLAVGSINMIDYSVISKVEVISTGKRLYLIILITSSGFIKNKVFRVSIDLSNDQLEFFYSFIKENLSGINVQDFTEAYLEKLTFALGIYTMVLSPFLNAIHILSEEVISGKFEFRGHSNILQRDNVEISQILKFLSDKQNLYNLASDVFDGIHVIFGNESEDFVVTNSSLLLSKCSIGDLDYGSFGLIGPIRLNYTKIIPYLEYFSKSITKLLLEFVSSNEEDSKLKGD
ncbi:MAG: heat-inducible transcription repressor HrcA [Oscillospiraceae bacterium]|nr:heat-inducible transcription repressor HrcA [Oscillospiraceae bacterium]